MKRFSLATCLLLSALTACGDSAQTEDSPGSGGPRPNVLLITLDTARADFLSCYGSTATKTPFLDSIAAEGALFENALTCSAVTPVSHATILTGQFPYGHGLRVLSGSGGFRLPEDADTLTTRLANAGYRTGAVHSAFPVSAYFGFDNGFEVFESFDGQLSDKEGEGDLRWDIKSLQRRSDETTERALAFALPGAEGAADSERPFFLWLHYWDVHDGLMVPPEEWLAELARDRRGNIQRDKLYAREMEYMDAQLGVLFDGLRAAGVLDSTIIAITADHGEGLSDGKATHDWSRHRVVYQQQLHVPLLLRGPGVPAGGVHSPLVRTADVAPTVLELAGLDPFDEAHGVSLTPLLAGIEWTPQVAYADQVNAFDTNAAMVRRRPQAAFLYSVVDEAWKLIYRPHMVDESELFDLGSDPEESENLWSTQTAERERMLLELAGRRPWVTAPLPPIGDDVPDASGALGALGYGGGDEDEDESAVGELHWTWICPRHLDREVGEWGRCELCEAPLLPKTTWGASAR